MGLAAAIWADGIGGGEVPDCRLLREAVSGSWIAKRETIKANDWAAITAAAAKATETVKAIRGK